jgi:selenocysteine lyase/cysteine desulfurase
MTPDLFHVPGPGPYALTHSIGCLPKVSQAALERGFLQPWITRGGNTWPDWLQQIEGFRAELAALLGGSAAEYCPQSNLSSGLAKLLSALPPPTGRKRVLLAAEDSFPSLGFVLQQAQRSGHTLRLIPRAFDPSQLGTWSDAITADIRAVLVTHVHSNTGGVAPVAAIARLCGECGALCIVDIAQSAGILPVSIHDMGADVVLGSCVKWLCGGPGAGFMWVQAALNEALEPVDVGWFSHADPFELDIHSFRYAQDSRRFWGGTPSVAPFVVAAASVRLIREIGVPALLAHNRQLAQTFADELPASWRARIPSGERGGTLCIPAGAELELVRGALSVAGVQFDCRETTVRLSFHACNTIADAVRVARAWPGGY